MGKHVKLTAPKSKPGRRGVAVRPDSKSNASAKLAESITLLARTAVLLDHMVAAIEDALAKGEGNSALVRESAGLVRAAASLSAEQRALARAAALEEERKAGNVLDQLTVDIAIQFIRGLPDREQWRAFHRLRNGDHAEAGDDPRGSRGGVLG